MAIGNEIAAEKAGIRRVKHKQLIEWTLEIPEMVENGLRNVFMELLDTHGNVSYEYKSGKIKAEYQGKKTPREVELEILYNLDHALADMTNIQMRRKGLSMVPGGFF